MKHIRNSRKRTGGLTALALAGLLAGQAARAEVITFETSLAPATAGDIGLSVMPGSDLAFGTSAASYQPIPYVHIGYPGYDALYYCLTYGTPYWTDHTTGSYGGTHNAAFQYYGYNSGSDAYPIVFNFDQPVAIPSFYLCAWVPGNVLVRAFSDTAGTSLLYSNTVAVPATWGGWMHFTDLASLNTNIMRLEIGALADDAIVDDITVYASTNVAAFGSLQGIQFQLSSDTLQPGLTRQPVVLAKYAAVTNDVTTWGTFSSSDPNVATVPEQGGAVTAVAPGTASFTATFGGFTATQTVTVTSLPAATTLVTFNDAYSSQPSGTIIQISAIWYPVPGITDTYNNVGLFNGGPDHTGAALGNNNWSSCQYDSTAGPAVITFTAPVSIPSLWLTTAAGSGDSITISAYSDVAGTVLLGTVTVPTLSHAGAGSFQWVQSTALDSSTYNGKIMNIQISSPAGDAQVDDMSVTPNYGTLTGLTTTVADTSLKPSMARQLTVTGNYQSNNINVTRSALFSSSAPSVASVTPYGLVKAVGGGSATISASLPGYTFTNTVTVTVSALPANGTLVTFNDGGWPQHMYNFAPIDYSGYEPVPSLYIQWPASSPTFKGIQLLDGVGNTYVPDHTTALGATVLAGGNNYCAIASDAAMVFNRPVGIPSVYLSTTDGSASVIVQAFSDAAGTTSIYSNAVPTSATPWGWTEFTGLASLNNTIKRVRFANATGAAAFDDMTVVAPPLGALQSIQLTLPQTTCVINSSQSATVLADYANVANVNVSVGCGTVYSSSDNNVATVTTNGLVTAVHGGSATITATLGSSTSSVVVKVTTSLQYSVSTSGGSSTLTFSWPTSVGASFVLQTSPVLGPGAVWTAVSGTPTVVGSNYQLDVQVNPATPAAFYRLGQ